MHSLSQRPLWVGQVNGGIGSQQLLKVKVSQLVLEVLELLPEVDRRQLVSGRVSLHRLLRNNQWNEVYSTGDRMAQLVERWTRVPKT